MKFNPALLALALTMFLSQASAQQGSTLVEEYFSENDRGWNLGDENNVTRKIDDGKMILECRKHLGGGGGYWIKLPDFKLPADNYSISVTTKWIRNAKKEGDGYSPYGLIIGDYYFLIYGDANRRLLKYNTIDKKYEVVVDWGTSGALHERDSDANKLEIQYKDGKASFYANGEMLYKKEMSIPDGTPVKLYLENSEVVAYDDLIVKKL